MPPTSPCWALDVLLSEISGVTSVMRRNARWRDALLHSAQLYELELERAMAAPVSAATLTASAINAAFSGGGNKAPYGHADLGREDVAAQSISGLLTLGFVRLRHTIAACKSTLATMTNASTLPLDSMEVLTPFLQVILSAETTGPITGAALASIERLIQCGIIDFDGAAGPNACQSIVHAATHCKFEATDAAADECVLLRILSVLKSLFSTPSAVRLLSDQAVCEMVETASSMCFQMRLSELLRRHAEQIVVYLIQTTLDEVDSEIAASRPITGHHSQVQVRMAIHDPPAPVAPKDDRDGFVDVATNSPVSVIYAQSATATAATGSQLFGASLASLNHLRPANDSEQPQFAADEWRPFGKAAAREIMRFLISLLNPYDPHNTETMRIVSLHIFVSVIESSSNLLSSDKNLKNLLAETGLKHLLQLLRAAYSQRNMTVMSLSLRAATSFMLRCGHSLHCHREFYLTYLLQLLSHQTPSPSLLMHSMDNTNRTVNEERLVQKMSHILVSHGCHWFSGDNGDAIFASGAQTVEQHLEPISPIKLLQYDDHQRMLLSFGAVSDPLPLELRQLVMESLSTLGMNPDFFVRLFMDYDCSLADSDMFENTVIALCRAAMMPTLLQECQMKDDRHSPVSHSGYDGDAASDMASLSGMPSGEQLGSSPFHGFSSAALEMLASLLSAMLDRVITHGFEIVQTVGDAHGTSSSINSSTTALEELLARKKKKRIFTRASSLFNQGLSAECFNYLASHEILPPSPSPADLAGFFHQAPLLNKKLLGEYLSKPKHFDTLKAYVDKFAWHGELRIDEALRIMLENFRLPGEAQQILRVVEAFSGGFFEHVVRKQLERQVDSGDKSEGTLPANTDAVFVLAYSAIMLNTDQHNPQVRRRMQPEDFVKNLRGTNNGANFSREYLENVYHAIRANEIIMPDEHGESLVGFEYQWNNLHKRAKRRDSADTAGNLSGDDDDAAALVRFDREAFLFSWRLLATTILYAYSTSESKIRLQKAIGSYYKLCSLAFYYGCYDVLDELIVAIAKSTKLCTTPASSSPSDHPAMAIWRRNQYESDYDFRRRRAVFLSWFSRNFRAQMALVFVFHVLSEFGSAVSVTWNYVADIVYLLYQMDILGAPLTMGISFGDATPDIRKDHIVRKVPYRSELSRQFRTQQQQESPTTSIFSALSSFLLSTSAPDGPSATQPVAKYIPDDEEKKTDESVRQLMEQMNVGRVLVEKSVFMVDRALCSLIDALFERAFVQNASADTHVKPLEQVEIDRCTFAISVSSRILLLNIGRLSCAWTTIERYIFGTVLRNFVQWHHLVVQEALTASFQLLAALLAESVGGRPKQEEVFSQIVSELLAFTDAITVAPPVPEGSPSKRLDIHPVSGIAAGCSMLNEVGLVLAAGTLCAVRKYLEHSSSGADLVTADLWPYLFSVVSATAGEVGMHSPPRAGVDEGGEGAAPYSWEILKAMSEASGFFQPLDQTPWSTPIHTERFIDLLDMYTSFVNASSSVAAQHASGVIVSASSIASKLASAVARSSVDTAGDMVNQADNEFASPIQRKHAAAISRGLYAMKRIYDLSLAIPAVTLALRSDDKVTFGDWRNSWLPLFSSLSQQCYHPCREIRQNALTYLQRALAACDTSSTGTDVTVYANMFNDVLFPLLETLLKPEVLTLDYYPPLSKRETLSRTASETSLDASMSSARKNSNSAYNRGATIDEIRIQASKLLTKIFLQQLHNLHQHLPPDELERLWVRILQLMANYWQCGVASRSKAAQAGSDFSLTEAVPESIKNMLLVMSTSNLFREGSGGLWTVTWELLDPWLPNLRKELFEDEAPKEVKPAAEETNAK